jgi:hypothetical protein
MVSTDGSGNIVKWVMSVFSGIINAEGRFEGTQAIILNPPIFCGEECGGGGITDFVGVNLLSDDSEWDAGVVVPAAPEPATLTLIAGGLLAIARRRLRRS